MMSKSASRGGYSIEKVLEEVQETQIRESTSTTKAQNSGNSSELNFRPGYVHLLKSKFSQLSESKNSKENKDSVKKHNHSIDKKQLSNSEHSVSLISNNATQPQVKGDTYTQKISPRNLSHPANASLHKNNQPSVQNTSKISPRNPPFPSASNYIEQPVQNTPKISPKNPPLAKTSFHNNNEKPVQNKKEADNTGEKVPEEKTNHLSDTKDVLPMRNIVSATRFLFENLGSNSGSISGSFSNSNDYAPARLKQEKQFPSLPEKSESKGITQPEVKPHFPRSQSNSKTIEFNKRQLDASPSPSISKGDSDKKSFPHSKKLSNTIFENGNGKAENRKLETPISNSRIVKPTDTSPAKDYLPSKKPLILSSGSQNNDALSSNVSPKSQAPKPVSKETNQESLWKTFEDIPVPRRRTFVDDAKNVKISKDELQSGRQNTKSWLFTTDAKKSSEKNVIAVQVKPSQPSNHSVKSANNSIQYEKNNNQISEERLAQQTFWDSYRNSNDRDNLSLNKDSLDEIDLILKRKDNISPNGDHETSNGTLSDSKKTKYSNGSLVKNPNKIKRNIKFAAQSELVKEYEYQSEQSFYNEHGIIPEYDQIIENQNDNVEDEDDDDEDSDYVFLNPNEPNRQTVAFSSYQTKVAAEFSWSQPNLPGVKTTPPLASPESFRVTPTESETKSPPLPEESFSFSDTTHCDTDLLF